MLLFRSTKVQYLPAGNNINLFSYMGQPNVPMNLVVITTGNISSNSVTSYAMTMGGANTWAGGTTIVFKISSNNSIRGASASNGQVGGGGAGSANGTYNGGAGSNGHSGHFGGRALSIDTTLNENPSKKVLVYIVNEGVIASGNAGVGGLGGGGGGGGATDEA
jgi:hypothetical protein